MLTSPDRIRSLTRAWPLVLALLLIATMASAQDIVVTSADPPSAEQETYDLDVMVSGENFPSGAEVEFFVHCPLPPDTDPDCEEGDTGIDVGKVKRQGPKTLKVTIDVLPNAQTKYKLDIEVRRGGRSGKGTELFGVTKKEHPTQDTIPPGEPTDLRIFEEKYGTVMIAWTMPADDGTDALSGPVEYCVARNYFPDGEEAPGGSRCRDFLPWAPPGQEQECIFMRLDPETDYLLGVSCVDDAGNWSTEARTPSTIRTQPFSLFKDPSWAIEEVPYPLNMLAGHRFDGAGNLVIGGVKYLWDQKRKGSSPVPAVIRIITGDQSSGSWAWSVEDVPGFSGLLEGVHRIRIDPQGKPAFVGKFCSGPKRCRVQLAYTFHSGEEWVSEVLPTGVGYQGHLGFAFDTNGQPAVAWCSGGSPGGVRLGRRIAADQWDVVVVNETDCDLTYKGVGELVFDDLGNPAISYDSADETRVALWTESGWIEEVVQFAGFPAGFPSGSSSHLTYDSRRGDFTTAGDNMIVCDRLGADNWPCERLSFGYGVYNSGIFSGFDSSGEFFMAHTTYAEQDVALAWRLAGAGWTREIVDYFREHDLPDRPHQKGPYLAFDPLDRPTLTWDWRLGNWNRPSEYHLYFAWKETP